MNVVEILHVDWASPQRFAAPPGFLATDNDPRFPTPGLLAAAEQFGCVAEAEQEQVAG
jgi:hypothetical protein